MRHQLGVPVEHHGFTLLPALDVGLARLENGQTMRDQRAQPDENCCKLLMVRKERLVVGEGLCLYLTPKTLRISLR